MKRFLASASLVALALAGPLSVPTPLPFGAATAFAQAAVTVENITFKGDAGSVTIPRIVVEGSAATKEEIEALFDPKATASLGGRIARLSARSVTIPSIEIIQNSAEGAGATIYRNSVMRDIRDGVAAEATIEQIVTSVKPKADGKDAPAIEITMADSSMKGLDLGLWTRFFFDKAQPGEARKPALLAQRIGQTRYKMGDMADFTIAEITGTEFYLRPLKVPLAELQAQAERLAKSGSKADPASSFGMVADVFDAMGFGEMRMKRLAGDVKAEGKPAMMVGIDEMVFAGGAQNRFQMTGLKIGNGADRFDLAEFSVDGMDLSAMMAALNAMASQGGGMTLPDPATMIPKLSAVRLSGLDIDVPDAKAAGQRVKAKLGLFETRMGNHVGTIPGDVSMTVDRLQMDIPPNTREKGLQDILAMGYKSLDLSARYDHAWSEATKTLTLRELSLRSGGMATVSAKAEIGNVPRELFTLDKAVASVAALGVAARNLQINVTNDSLFEKLIAKTARESRRKADDVRAELAAGATMMVPLLLGDHPAARPIGAALGKFVADPKNLRIDVKAKGEGIGPTDFLAVSDPTELLKKLDITATANQ